MNYHVSPSISTTNMKSSKRLSSTFQPAGAALIGAITLAPVVVYHGHNPSLHRLLGIQQDLSALQPMLYRIAFPQPPFRSLSL